MPLTTFQQRVRGNRSEASHFAGSLVLNVGDASSRYSHDFELFHDAIGDLWRSSEEDVAALEKAGLQVEKLNEHGGWDEERSFRKAIVRAEGDELAIDRAQDSAWRFFPIIEDPLLGWRLHLFDMATNKGCWPVIHGIHVD